MRERERRALTSTAQQEGRGEAKANSMAVLTLFSEVTGRKKKLSGAPPLVGTGFPHCPVAEGGESSIGLWNSVCRVNARSLAASVDLLLHIAPSSEQVPHSRKGGGESDFGFLDDIPLFPPLLLLRTYVQASRGTDFSFRKRCTAISFGGRRRLFKASLRQHTDRPHRPFVRCPFG